MFKEGRHGGKDEGAIVVLDTKYIRALFVFVWLTMKEAQTRPLKSINRLTFSRHGIYRFAAQSNHLMNESSNIFICIN